ncbi:DUF2845 domain-containing protein [Archangium lipolyticum]|uniref:DUF2845 domain-containing protein n=1 Tax=Archangium lipolyticum TaxID=2970465 RepID=UPI002149F887|nr:DUF2845 domain-containing protein [Archangium lipolyticum]
MRALLATLTLSFLLLPARGDAATLRCGNNLVADGASKTDVLLKCGEPAAKESRTESDAVKQRRGGKNDSDSTTTEQVVQKTIEEWTYNFGPNRLIQVAVFENGKLVDVRSGGYGR